MLRPVVKLECCGLRFVSSRGLMRARSTYAKTFPGTNNGLFYWTIVTAVRFGTLPLIKGSDDAILPLRRNPFFSPDHQDQRMLRSNYLAGKLLASRLQQF